MLQIRRILQLKEKGKSNRRIALELHLSRDTVNEYVGRINQLGKSCQHLLKLNDEELASLVINEPAIAQQDQRYADMQERLSNLCDELQKPHATRMVLWEEYLQQVPNGYSYTQFCEYLSRFLQTRKAVMNFEHEPAAVMMFDFAGDKLPLINKQNGEITKCPVLVCTLPFSGYTFIKALLSANRQQLLQALNDALFYFGGAPLSTLTDNMKQIIKKSNRYEPSIDELAEQWSLHYNTTMMAARVRKPRDKATVESHVNAIYNRIYAPLRNQEFYSIDQMNYLLLEELERFNTRNLQGRDYSRRDRFSLHEKALLQPLPLTPFVAKNKVSVKVQRNYHITLWEDHHHYSVPFRYISSKAEVIYDTENIEIYVGSARIACYKRNYIKNGYTTMSDHMPPAHRHYSIIKGWNGEYFIDKATQIGESTLQSIKKILEQQIFVEQTYNSCLGVLRLGGKYGNDRLEAACLRANISSKVTYTLIKNILEKNLDKAIFQEDVFLNIPDHDNIRGEASYK